MPTGQKEKPPLPGWSEKIGQGILSGKLINVSSDKGDQKTPLHSVVHRLCIQ